MEENNNKEMRKKNIICFWQNIQQKIHYYIQIVILFAFSIFFFPFFLKDNAVIKNMYAKNTTPFVINYYFATHICTLIKIF